MVDDVPDKRIVHGILEHRLGGADFVLVQYRWSPASASPFSGRGEPRSGVFDNQFTLKLIECGANVEE
jgi:hypothetical protein